MTAPGPDAPPPDPAARVAVSAVPLPGPVTGFSGAAPGDRPPPNQRPRTRRRWLGALLGAAVAVVVALVLALGLDWAARSYGMSQLLDRVETSEAAMTRYQERVADVDLPEDPSDAERQQAAAGLRRAAADGRDEVLEAGRGVAAVSFLPWHSDLLAAQQAYLAHNRAWGDYLGRGARDVSVLLGQDPLIDSTWTAAEVEVRGAAPWPTLPWIAATVDSIFAPADEDTGESPGLPA